MSIFRQLLSALTILTALSATATSYNIAPLARVEASSQLSGFPATAVNDGKARLVDRCEWRSTSSQTSWGQIDYPSIKLYWDQSHTINRVILYDTPSLDNHTAGVELHFSDSSRIFVNSIPNNGAPKVVDFAPKNIKWLEIKTSDVDGYNAGLSEVEVFTSVGGTPDYVGKVNPYIETARGRYFFFATGSLPFGMISSAPMTRNKNQYGGGYNYNSLEILGFPQLHDWMNAGINIMPTSGNISPIGGETSWKSIFSHDGEVVRPGYHKVYLDRYHMWVEQTATDRVSMYRCTYADSTKQSGVIINLGGYLGTITMVSPKVNKINATDIVGEFNTVGRLWGGPDSVKVYFVIQFDRPMKQMDSWIADKEYHNVQHLDCHTDYTKRHPAEYFSYYDAPSAGVVARFDTNIGEKLQYKIAVSYVSINNAIDNLNKECNHWDFDAVHQDATNIWNEYLGRIDVKGGSDNLQEKFYTDLWHVLLGRHKINDYNGDYPDYTQGRRDGAFTRNISFRQRSLPRDKDGNIKFNMYNSDSFWLSQWNLNVLWGLAWPEILDDFAACIIEYAENGGLIPRGPNIGGYSYIMTACPATNLITSAYQKDMLTKVSPEKAYKWLKINHEGGGMLGTKEEINFYKRYGYIPDNAGITLEVAFQDWALGEMAARMGKTNDAKYFHKRASQWDVLFHPEIKLIMPKKQNEQWLHDDPLNGWGWVEANAWQATWSVSHGLERLGDLMGGRDSMAQKLNHAFIQAQSKDFLSEYSNGYISYANQPGLSNAHVFNRIGHPELAQKWVRKVNCQAYGYNIPDRGYGGHDEDQGQMGGVNALMSIGLFSVTGTCSQSPVYDITSPIFDEITITLSPKYYEGEKFIIKSYRNNLEDYLIRRIELNGKPFDGFILKHSDFSKGGTLTIHH